MGRQYKCRSCGVVHDPPTGKHCANAAREDREGRNRDNAGRRQASPEHSPARDEGQGEQGQVLALLLDLQAKMSEMGREVAANTAQREATVDAPAVSETASSTDGAEGGQAVEVGQASPETIRGDRELMRAATHRLATLRQDEWEDEDGPSELIGVRLAGKRSGAVMTASDVVVRRIDWPHFYIQRLSGTSRKGIRFNELNIDEFVYGFVCMLNAPQCQLDRDRMIRLLGEVMQDSVDFSWENARNFYEMASLAVEKGRLNWADEAVVNQMRMTYSRTNVQQKREQREAAPAPAQRQPLQAAPAGMKCCATYQRRECENSRDHHPFTHACAYCFKAKTALCRHPEQDCYRKVTDAKNGKQGE